MKQLTKLQKLEVLDKLINLYTTADGFVCGICYEFSDIIDEMKDLHFGVDMEDIFPELDKAIWEDYLDNSGYAYITNRIKSENPTLGDKLINKLVIAKRLEILNNVRKEIDNE